MDTIEKHVVRIKPVEPKLMRGMYILRPNYNSNLELSTDKDAATHGVEIKSTDIATIPPGGKQLNLGNQKQLIEYIILKNSEYCVMNSSHKNKKTLFILYDEILEANETVKKMGVKKKAYVALDEMTPVHKRRFLRLFGRVRTESIPDIVIEQQLFEEIENNAAEFVRKYEDEHRDIRILVREFEDSGILRKEQMGYYFNEKNIGLTEESVVIFIKDKSNNDIVQSWIAMIKNKGIETKGIADEPIKTKKPVKNDNTGNAQPIQG